MPIAKAGETPEGGELARILTPEEFTRSGLQKLTPTELSSLETALLQHHQLSASPVTGSMATENPSSIGPSSLAREKIEPSGDKSRGFGAEQVTKPKPDETGAEMRSHIEGTLDGFSGRAVFVLGNGQIWQQRVPETVYFAKKLVDPEVVLTRSFAGYKMLIVPANRVVFVKRIQ